MNGLIAWFHVYRKIYGFYHCFHLCSFMVYIDFWNVHMDRFFSNLLNLLKMCAFGFVVQSWILSCTDLHRWWFLVMNVDERRSFDVFCGRIDDWMKVLWGGLEASNFERKWWFLGVLEEGKKEAQNAERAISEAVYSSGPKFARADHFQRLDHSSPPNLGQFTLADPTLLESQWLERTSGPLKPTVQSA